MFDPYNPYNNLPELPSMDDLTPEEQEEVRIKSLLYGCCAYILALAIAMVLCAFFSSCRTTQTVVELRDSILTKVVTNTVYVPDTQYVTLPTQTVERITPDTTSTLRTDYATSTVTIHDGLLHHSLTTNSTPVPVPVQNKIVTRDSIVYREREVPVPVIQEVEVEKPLTAWQQARLWLGNAVLVALAALAAAWLFRKRAWWLRFFNKSI